MGVVSNISGTTETSFKIGLTGPTVKIGTSDPTSGPLAGSPGDIYIRTGSGNEQIWQRTASSWVRALDTRGSQTMAGNLTFGTGYAPVLDDGSVSAPSLRFSNATSTGLYLSDTDTLSIAAGGIQAIEITPSTVFIKGDLYVQGSTSTVHSTDLEVEDNIILLNNQEMGAGVSLGTAGIEIDRGSEPNVSWLFDEPTMSFGPVGASRLINIDRIDTGTTSGLVISGTGAVTLPSGDASQRPGSPAEGMVRFRSDSKDLEIYDGTTWKTFLTNVGGGFVSTGGDTMTGDLIMAMGARIRLTNGSAANPSLTFDSDTDTGLYRVTTNSLGIAVGGALAVTFAPTQVEYGLRIVNVSGSAATPAYSFVSDPDTGIIASSVNEVGLVAGGNTVFTVGTNHSIFTLNGSLALPRGTTAQRLGTTNGEIRYNTDTNETEFRTSGRWIGVGSPATGAVSLDDGNNSATGSYSTVIGGANASAYLYGQRAYASGRFSVNGDAQISSLIARSITTNATPTLLYLDGASQKMVIPANTTWGFRIHIVGRRTDGGGLEDAAYLVEGVIANDGGTTAFTGSTTKTVYAEDQTSWDVNAVANDSTDSLDIEVTGTLGATVHWVARVELVEVR